MTVITSEPAGPLKIRLVVGISYTNDSDLANEASVSVEGTGPDGATLAATPLPRQEGAKYGATVDVPVSGSWQLTITSTKPTATASTTVEAAEQTTSTKPPMTTTELAPATTTANATPSTTTTELPAAVDEKNDSGSNTGMIVLIGAVAVVVIVGAVLVLRSRKDTPPE